MFILANNVIWKNSIHSQNPKQILTLSMNFISIFLSASHTLQVNILITLLPRVPVHPIVRESMTHASYLLIYLTPSLNLAASGQQLWCGQL